MASSAERIHRYLAENSLRTNKQIAESLHWSAR